MKVARLPVGMLEAEAAFAEIDFAGDARVDHPLQRAVDGRAADAVIFAADEIDQIVGAEMAFLAQEHIDDLFPLAGSFPAVWLQPAEIGKVVHAGSPRRRDVRR